MADAVIFSAQRLLLVWNSWQKLIPCCSQNHPRKRVLRLTMKSSMYVDYCLPWNRWGKLGPGTQKSSNKPSSMADAVIFSAQRLLLVWNSWQKLIPCCSQNHPRKRVLRLTMKSSMYVDYCLPRNRWGKLGPRDPKIIQQAQFYGRRWHLQRTNTNTGSETVDRNWVPAVPKIILENQLYGWRWNLQCT
jgi:hypothetical protein